MLGLVPPHDHGEERCLLVPPTADGHPEHSPCDAALGVADLGLVGEVAGEADGCLGHGAAPSTIAIQRALGRLVGLQEHELRQLVRISYAKVAEFQRRGAIHFHAVIRLDAATACRCPDCLLPPPEPFAADLLEDALKQAVPVVQVPCPAVDGWPARYARWGEQLDVHNI